MQGSASHPPALTPHRRGGEFLAMSALILFAAFALRLWNLDTQSLWHDEAWSVFSAYNPFAPMGIRGADLNAPFVFYSTLGAWIRLVGDSVWSMRYWSLVVGVITVAVTGLIARRWFGPGTGLLASLFAAANPILWVFSQEIRAYVAMPLAALALLVLLEPILKQRPAQASGRGFLRPWLLLWATELATLYAHNLSVPIVAWLNAAAISALLLRRHWRGLAVWFVGQIALLIVYLPWLLTQRQTGTPLNTPPALTSALIWDIWQSYFTGVKPMVGVDTPLMALTAAFGVAALIGGLLALLRHRTARVWLLLSQVALLPVFQLAIILAAHIDFHPRYFIVGVPATLILVAAGFAPIRVPERQSLPIRRLISRSFGVAAAGLAVLSILIFGRMAAVLYSSPIYQHDDFRSIAQRYAALGQDAAIVIPYGWEPTLDYYRRKMNFQAKFIEIPLHSSAEAVFTRLHEGLQAVKRAELLTWYQLPADVRGAYPCILGAAGKRGEEVTVSGLKTESYLSLSDQAFSVKFDQTALPGVIHFGPVDLIDHATVTGKQAACLVGFWKLRHQTGDDWRVASRLRSAEGWDVPGTDASILSDTQLPTSAWAAGVAGASFISLPLAEGLPPGYYTVNYSVYGAHASGPVEIVRQDPQTSQWVNRGTRTTVDELMIDLRGEYIAAPATDDRKFADEVYLHRSHVPEDRYLKQGQRLEVTLEWHLTPEFQPDAFQSVWLVLAGESELDRSLIPFWPQSPLITRQVIRVPDDASGKVALKIVHEFGDGASILLGEYEILPIARVMSEPTMALNARLAQPADFSGVGLLVGANVLTPVSMATQPTVALLWRGGSATLPILETDYTVFVHLRDGDGNIIAQSDAQPMNGSRPTTSWIAGEYVLDEHTLKWNRTDYRGPATVAVGLYDQATGQRVKLSDSREFIVLPVSVVVR